MSVVRYWNRLSREVVEALFLEIFKAGLHSEHPDLAVVVPAHFRIVGLNDL